MKERNLLLETIIKNVNQSMNQNSKTNEDIQKEGVNGRNKETKYNSKE